MKHKLLWQTSAAGRKIAEVMSGREGLVAFVRT